jgi:hypothetical protein
MMVVLVVVLVVVLERAWGIHRVTEMGAMVTTVGVAMAAVAEEGAQVGQCLALVLPRIHIVIEWVQGEVA